MGREAAGLTPEMLLSKLRSIRPADTYALAVSGGRDSMGLLGLAAAAAKLPSAPRFIALSVDHGLRADAQAEARMVADACQELGLEHHVLTADEKLGDTDIQQQARRLRYRLMAAFCRPLKAPLVTAHHLHDQAETVAMRLARGSGVDGLAAMAPSQWLDTEAGRLLLLRPFLDTPPEALHGDLPHIDDPSNEDTRFERVRWRQKRGQMTAAGMSPAALAALARDMRALRIQRDAALHDWLSDHAVWHDYGVLVLPRDEWRVLPYRWRAALLAACVRYFGGHAHPPRRDAITGFAAGLDEAKSGAAVLGGVLMRWRTKQLFLGREYAALADKPQPHPAAALWDARFHVAALPDGHFVAPLGPAGIAAMRATGMAFDKAVPAAYHAVLPGLFKHDADGMAVLAGPATEKNLARVSSDSLFDALFGRSQDW